MCLSLQPCVCWSDDSACMNVFGVEVSGFIQQNQSGTLQTSRLVLEARIRKNMTAKLKTGKDDKTIALQSQSLKLQKQMFQNHPQGPFKVMLQLQCGNPHGQRPVIVPAVSVHVYGSHVVSLRSIACCWVQFLLINKWKVSLWSTDRVLQATERSLFPGPGWPILGHEKACILASLPSCIVSTPKDIYRFLHFSNLHWSFLGAGWNWSFRMFLDPSLLRERSQKNNFVRRSEKWTKAQVQKWK